ncbi:MAG: HzsA-related protein [Thermoguttaceae bacterium]
MKYRPLVLSLLLLGLAVGPVAGQDSGVRPQETWVDAMLAARNECQAAASRRQEAAPSLCRRLWEEFAEMDWFLQDHPGRQPEAGRVDVQKAFGWYLEPRRDAAGERDMIARALAELPAGNTLQPRLDALVQEDPGPDDSRWLDLYVDACRQRRKRRLESLLRQVPEIVFAKHYTLGGSHYAYTEGLSDAQAERHFQPGSALCLLRYDGTTVSVETLLDDPGGVIRDPDVSFDARRVLFSWKKSDREDDYHLYEIDLASRDVRQLTSGLGVADYEGAYLPCGDIVFNSSRCVQTVDCWWTEVSNLYRCDRDGGTLRRLTFDQVHDNLPTVTDDQRILYTRWEYNDRGQVYPQPLMQMNPDGTGQSDFYGGNSWFPTTILHARSVPGTGKVVAVASGHHTRQTGKLILIDPAKGRQENSGVQLIAPPRRTPAEKIDRYGQEGEIFQYPYPLDEDEYLVTYHPIGWDWEDPLVPRTGIYWISIDGRRELLASDAGLPCSQSIPLRPRRVSWNRASLVDYRKDQSTCYVQNVYIGPGLAGIPRGEIETLRVVALDFRAAGIGENRNGGPGGGALISTPVSIGNGAWDPKIVLGDATVYEDGSAFFSLPARTPVYFQLLDRQGRMVQSMRSWTTLQPGEAGSCVGCHEHKNTTPAAGLPLTAAIAAGAQSLRPFYGSARGFSFPAEIQPILDRKCVGCHGPARGDQPDLSGSEVLDLYAKRRWSRAFLSLTHAQPDPDRGCWRGDPDHPLVNWISAQSAPPMLLPRSAGSAASGLVRLLTAGHEGVTLSREEMDKFCAWIDLGVPFCGDYREANSWNADEVATYRHYLEKRERLAEEERASVESLRSGGD